MPGNHQHFVVCGLPIPCLEPGLVTSAPFTETLSVRFYSSAQCSWSGTYQGTFPE